MAADRKGGCARVGIRPPVPPTVLGRTPDLVGRCLVRGHAGTGQRGRGKQGGMDAPTPRARLHPPQLTSASALCAVTHTRCTRRTGQGPGPRAGHGQVPWTRGTA
jgi:hypothetical protein